MKDVDSKDMKPSSAEEADANFELLEELQAYFCTKNIALLKHEEVHFP